MRFKLFLLTLLVSMPAYADFVPGDVGSPASFPNGLGNADGQIRTDGTCTVADAVCSGDWTPTLGALGSNVDARGVSPGYFLKVGDKIWASVSVTIDVNTASTATSQTFGLPIPSSIGSSNDVVGNCATLDTSVDLSGSAAFIEGDSAANEWKIRYRNPKTSNTEWACTFTYRIL